MKVLIMCEKNGVETHLYLPLLKYDKIDTNSYQKISLASKRTWPLPQLFHWGCWPHDREASWSNHLECQWALPRLTGHEEPGVSSSLLPTTDMPTAPASAGWWWRASPEFQPQEGPHFQATAELRWARCSLPLRRHWDWMHWIFQSCFITQRANHDF